MGHQEKEQPLETLLVPVFREGALIEFTGKRGLTVLSDAPTLLKTDFVNLKEGDLLIYLNSIYVDNDDYVIGDKTSMPMSLLVGKSSCKAVMTQKVLELTGHERGGNIYSLFHRFLFGDKVIRIIDETANLLDDFKYAYQPRP